MTRKLKPGALAKAVAEMENKGYDLEHMAMRVHQHAPPVHAKTIKAWIAGTAHPTQDQCDYMLSAFHSSYEELFDEVE